MKIKFETLFGSYVTGEFREGSDIDVAVITRKRDFNENVKILKDLLGVVSKAINVSKPQNLPQYGLQCPSCIS